MRRFDKKNKIERANILAERRYLSSKGLISESFHDLDGTPIGVDKNHEPISEKENTDNPCWDGYEMIGMKNVGGKEVPNCVPIKNESHVGPTGDIDSTFTDPSVDDDSTLIVRIKALSDALNHYESEGDSEMVSRLRDDIQRLESELGGRKDLDRDFYGREINENKDIEKEEAWKKFQKEKHVTSDTIKAAEKDFEKEWERKNK